LFVPLGCLEQWISIRGDDRSNPVLLVVHGGPGEAQWPAADIVIPWVIKGKHLGSSFSRKN
jgi:hypothetical protein